MSDLFASAVDTDQNDQRVNCSKLYFILLFRHVLIDIKEDENLPPSKQYSKFFPMETRMNIGIKERPSILNFSQASCLIFVQSAFLFRP